MMKKQLIMEKALELFAKQGFEATSVQQITELCGISKGAFYLSFKSKDELISALIDYFIMKIFSDVDYVVRDTGNDEKLLYNFYYTSFGFFDKHSDFAKIFIKEQIQSFNEELLSKMGEFDKTFEKTILSMVERLYGEGIEHTKYDLVYCIKGFIKIYSELFIFCSLPMDLDLLCRTLVEKTNVLAKHTTIPFITEEFKQIFKLPLDGEFKKEQILELMDQKIVEIEESIEKESLILLRQELIQPKLCPAIIKGLVGNIGNHHQCKWIAYLLRTHYEW